MRVLINGLALWIASWILPGLDIFTPAAGEAVARTGVEWTDAAGIILAYLFVGTMIAVNEPRLALTGIAVLAGFILLYFIVKGFKLANQDS